MNRLTPLSLRLTLLLLTFLVVIVFTQGGPTSAHSVSNTKYFSLVVTDWSMPANFPYLDSWGSASSNHSDSSAITITYSWQDMLVSDIGDGGCTEEPINDGEYCIWSLELDTFYSTFGGSWSVPNADFGSAYMCSDSGSDHWCGYDYSGS